MNTKDTAILLIFLLAVLGLLMGIYCTNEANSEITHKNSVEKVYEDKNGTITITLEPKEKENIIIKYFEKKMDND